MILIVGLGNPGKECTNTRHNIGREIVIALNKKLEGGEFRFEKKWNAEVVELKIGKEKIVVALPDTFMNTSGDALGPIARFYKIKQDHTYVIHDDADIELGHAKLSFGKHSAGHKGVESAIRALKTRNFWRFRVGIGGKRNIPAKKLVLKKFTPDEMKIIKRVTKKTVETMIEASMKGGERAMNIYNTK